MSHFILELFIVKVYAQYDIYGKPISLYLWETCKFMCKTILN